MTATFSDPLINPGTSFHSDSASQSGSNLSSYGSTGLTEGVYAVQGRHFQLMVNEDRCSLCDNVFKEGDSFRAYRHESHGLIAAHNGCITVLSAPRCIDILSSSERNYHSINENCRKALLRSQLYRIANVAQKNRIKEAAESPFAIIGDTYTLQVNESTCWLCQEVFRRGELFRVHQCEVDLVAFHERCFTALNGLGIYTDGSCSKDLSTEELSRTPTLEESRRSKIESDRKSRETNQMVCTSRTATIAWVLFSMCCCGVGIGVAPI